MRSRAFCRIHIPRFLVHIDKVKLDAKSKRAILLQSQYSASLYSYRWGHRRTVMPVWVIDLKAYAANNTDINNPTRLGFEPRPCQLPCFLYIVFCGLFSDALDGIFAAAIASLFELQKLASIPPSAFYSDEHKHLAASLVRFCFFKVCSKCVIIITRGQSNLTKSASRGAHSPLRGHPRGSKVVLLNSWGRVSY